METIVGTAAGNKTLVDPVIGTAGGNRQVMEIWVGSQGGNRQVFARSTAVVLTATPASTSSVSLTWNDAGDGITYVVKRGTTTIYTGSGLSKTDTGLSASTTYNYSIEAKLGSVVMSSDTASAKTLAPTTQQKTVTLSRLTSGSYTGSGSLRASSGSHWVGYYSSNQGLQKSSFHFAIPSDLRNCVSVDKVEFRLRNSHTYSGTGMNQTLAVTHTQTAGSTWPGSTGAFGSRWTAKGGWYGGAEWVNITADKEPTFNDTVAENFRKRGAWGICLVAKDSTQAHYGYYDSSTAQLRLTYVINT